VRIFSATCEAAPGIGDPLDDDQELVATQAADGVRFPHQPPQAPRHLAEDPIAGLMAERVVDDLEAVEIDEQDRQFGFIAVRPLHCLVQPVAQQQSVRQTGERIVVRLMVELIVRPAQLGDIREHADVVGDAALAVIHGTDRQGFEKGLSILAPVPELALPAPGGRQFLPHPDIEIPILTTRLQHARVAPDHLLLAVTGDLRERPVHRNDATVGGGDRDALGAAVEDGGRLLQPRLHPLALGDVEHHADQTAPGSSALTVGRLVKDDVAVAAVGVADLRLVNLRTATREEFVVGSLIAIGEIMRRDVVDSGAHHFAALFADQFQKRLVAAEITPFTLL
jgi:hypothetical protein